MTKKSSEKERGVRLTGKQIFDTFGYRGVVVKENDLKLIEKKLGNYVVVCGQ